MATCNLGECCEIVGDITGCNNDCDYSVNGINRIIFANVCDIQDYAYINGYYPADYQAGSTGFPAYGTALSTTENRACTLYQYNAVEDIIMEYVTGSSGPTKRWHEIKFVDESAIVTQSLVGGGEPASSKYLSTTLAFTIRGASQYLQNVIDQLNHGKIVVIIQTTEDFTQLALEVQNLLGAGTPYSPDPKTFILGHNGLGFKVTTNEFTAGGSPDSLMGYNITMTNIGRGYAQIIPLIDSAYSTGPTPVPAGYIVNPYDANPYTEYKPTCNLLAKLLNGFDGTPNP